MRVRRTIAIANGNDLDKIRAIIDSDADAIMLELEDLCPLPQKDEARAYAAQVLKEWDFKGTDKIVRINAANTELGQKDLAAILPALPDAIRLPKCETVEYVQMVDRQMSEFELSHNLKQYSIELILVIESPLGILNCYEMAKCSPRITGVGLGANDLANEMGIKRDLTAGSVQFLYAKQKMVMDAKAAGVDVFDTTVVCREDELEEVGRFIRKDTEDIKNMGFTGRSVSMLPHIAIINQVFEPSKEEAAHARKIVEGYHAALESGAKEIFIDGKFVDPPIVESAQKILDYIAEIKRKQALKQI